MLGFEDVEHFPLDSGPEAPLEVIGVGEDPQQKRGMGTDQLGAIIGRSPIRHLLHDDTGLTISEVKFADRVG